MILTIRQRIFLYRLKRNCDALLVQAQHRDIPINRSMQFGNSRGYWALVAIGFVAVVAAQIYVHDDDERMAAAGVVVAVR